MPLLGPCLSSARRRGVSLFEIRLDDDFIVFRGSEHESAGQQLRGVVVLCLSSPLKIEELRLRLNGTLRYSWTDAKPRSGRQGSASRVDRTIPVLEHAWPLLSGPATLRPGNYEWPFEYTLPGFASESVEGIPEASITYRLKATVARGRLAAGIHAHKPLRIVRTLDTGSLELLHAMSVENVWPNKVDYAIVLPRKAVPFGSAVALEMRLTPLLKGLEMGRISVRMLELRECSAPGTAPGTVRQHKAEREVASWRFDDVAGPGYWRDVIEETGQDGWVVNKALPLPRRLESCIQDLNHHGIRVRHKLKIAVGLRNPDGHISELRATLPISVFISPHIPLDEQGNLAPGALVPDAAVNAIAPPGYGDHVLDQPYECLRTAGFQTSVLSSHSALSTPRFSRAGSAVDLNGALPIAEAVTAAAAAAATTGELHVRHATLSPVLRNLPPDNPSTDQPLADGAPASQPLSRNETAEGADPTTTLSSLPSLHFDLGNLSKVPSYSTAVKSPARCGAWSGGALPSYESALAETGGETAVRRFTVPKAPSPEVPSGRVTLAALLRVPRPKRHQSHHVGSVTSLLVQRLHSGGEAGEEQRARWRATHARGSRIC